MAAVIDSQNRDYVVAVAPRGIRVGVVVLIIHATSARNLIMMRSRPSVRHRKASLPLQNRDRRERGRLPRRRRHVIPKLLGLLKPDAFNHLVPVIPELTMNKHAIEGLFVGLPAGPSRWHKGLVGPLVHSLGSNTSTKSSGVVAPSNTDRRRGSSSCLAVTRQAATVASTSSRSLSARPAISASCNSSAKACWSSLSNTRSHARLPSSLIDTSRSARMRKLSLCSVWDHSA